MLNLVEHCHFLINLLEFNCFNLSNSDWHYLRLKQIYFGFNILRTTLQSTVSMNDNLPGPLRNAIRAPHLETRNRYRKCNNYELISLIHAQDINQTFSVMFEFALPNHISITIKDLETSYSKQLFQLENLIW